MYNSRIAASVVFIRKLVICHWLYLILDHHNKEALYDLKLKFRNLDDGLVSVLYFI